MKLEFLVCWLRNSQFSFLLPVMPFTVSVPASAITELVLIVFLRPETFHHVSLLPNQLSLLLPVMPLAISIPACAVSKLVLVILLRPEALHQVPSSRLLKLPSQALSRALKLHTRVLRVLPPARCRVAYAFLGSGDLAVSAVRESMPLAFVAEIVAHAFSGFRPFALLAFLVAEGYGNKSQD